ncbi:MAG: Ger(x)C family spore germination protein [Syntrophomonadaceae bacterium]|jgi:spore germination protein KC
MTFSNKKLILITMAFLSCFFISGCWDSIDINSIATPVNIGIDLDKDGKIAFSTLFSQAQVAEESGNLQSTLFTTEASDYSVSLAARRQMLFLPRVPDWSNVQGVILGENIAQNGLYKTTDFFIRNRRLIPAAEIFIADGSTPGELLDNVCLTGKDSIAQLVRLNELLTGAYVPVSKEAFIYKLMTPGIEPAVPRLSLIESANNSKRLTGEEKNSIIGPKRMVLNGMAVFKGNKMVGNLNEYESRGYRWLNPSINRGGILIIKSPLTPGEYINLGIESFKSKTVPQVNGNNISMLLNIYVRFDFYDSTRPDIVYDQQLENDLRKAVEAEVSRQIRSCIEKSQNLNSDITGWGRILESRHPAEWKRVKSNWDNIYPLIKVDIRVEADINHTYLSKGTVKLR